MKYRVEEEGSADVGRVRVGPRSIDKKQIWKIGKNKRTREQCLVGCCLNHRAVWEGERGKRDFQANKKREKNSTVKLTAAIE